MTNDKLDWFPLYWQRFIIGTLKMNAEEIGAYILLLIHEWDNGFVPESPEEIKTISKVSYKKLTKVLKKFENINGKLYNNPLEIIRIEQAEKNEKNSNRGKNGAKARWDKHKSSNAQALHKQCLDDSNREEEKRREKKRKEEKREEKKKGDHLFANSEFFDFEKFQESFSGTDYEFCDLKIYYEKVKNWSAGKGAKRKDWIATARNFMLSDKQDNKLILKAGVYAKGNSKTEAENIGTELNDLITRKYGNAVT